ncbi:MAG: dihydrodipicolinate synthase family protein, partial [Burkholderiaceae bacterium]
HGNVSVTANVAPRAMHQLCVAAMAGKAREAAALHLKLLPLHTNLFIEPSPAPAKWALARMGICGAGLRLPITPLTPAGQTVMEQAMRESSLL